GDQLITYITEGPFKHLTTLISLAIFTAVFYFVFAWFREQVCVIACPYGRLQSVLLDNKSIVVAYDHKRGEREQGRKKFKKNEDRIDLGIGDCIDCKQCVHVCPTGIDIRNGTQLECVNCTACIDECDNIMESVGYPKGLIRYASIDNIEQKAPFKFTARMKAYTVVLSLLVGVLLSLLLLRSNVEASVLRLPGQLFERTEAGNISNVYTYKLINKTSNDYEDIRFELLSHPGTVKIVAGSVGLLEAEELISGTLFIEIPAGAIPKDNNRIEIGVFSGVEVLDELRVNFFGPKKF
ncbi:MAG: 4Fe-4S dicluster domain-containing protein, partial [Flavobacteriaceae bacterium]|nr:4Fe-4S dicluster domain-containing protein [Flavobacteriaceae bacterium]